MWMEDYEALHAAEKAEFRRLANALLSRTYLLRNVYDDQKKMMDMNSDYRTARRFFSILQGYFSLAGWDLYRDDEYGVIYLRNQQGSNRVRFGIFTTKFLYTLRLIYEENRQQVELHHDVRTDTFAVINKMGALGILKDGRSTAKEREEAQKTLARYRVIAKLDGGWKTDGNKLLIYPTILFFVPNSEINAMCRQLQEMRQNLQGAANGAEEPMSGEEEESGGEGPAEEGEDS